jgi:hypothetical protein
MELFDQHIGGWRIGEYGIPYLEWAWIDNPALTPRINTAVRAGVYVSKGLGNNRNKWTAISDYRNSTDEMPYYERLEDAMTLAEFIYWLPENAHKPSRNTTVTWWEYGRWINKNPFRRIHAKKSETHKEIQSDLFTDTIR